MHNIQIGIDSTDHIAFFCPECKNVMDIDNVVTSEVEIDSATKETDNCTWIYLHCSQCNAEGKRKMYWTESLDRASRNCKNRVSG